MGLWLEYDQVSHYLFFSCPDTVSTKQAWTPLKRSSSALAITSQTWTSAPFCLNWSPSSSTSARMKLSVSTVCPASSATMTPTSATSTRPSSPTAPPAWPLETSPTGVAEASASWSLAPTRTSLSFTLTGSCGYLPTSRSRTPSEWWMSTYWRATRSSTGLFLLPHVQLNPSVWVWDYSEVFCNHSFRVALALLNLYKVSVSSRVADVEDFRTDMKRFVQSIARHCTAEKLLEKAFMIPMATRRELNLLFNANKDSLMQKGVSLHQKRWVSRKKELPVRGTFLRHI